MTLSVLTFLYKSLQSKGKKYSIETVNSVRSIYYTSSATKISFPTMNKALWTLYAMQQSNNIVLVEEWNILQSL